MAEKLTTRVEDVRGSGVYPGSGPLPPGSAVVRSPAALGHPEAWTAADRTPSLEHAAMIGARAVFGGFFLYNAINHFRNRKMLADYARSKGVPAPDLAVPATGLLLLGGALSILTGVRPKWGAAFISTFLLGVSPQMHAFWKEQDPQQRMSEMVNFTKNMALVGASLFAAGHPEPWPARVPLASSGGALAATSS